MSSLLVLACTGLLPRQEAAVARRGETLLASSARAFLGGDLGSAVTSAKEVQQEAVASDDFVLRARALFARAGIERWIGETDSALVLVDRGLYWANRAEDLCLEAEGVLVRYAVLYSMHDRGTPALQSLEDIESLCGSAAVRSRAALTRARFAAREGQREDAHLLLEQSGGIFLPAGLQAQLRQERLFLKAYLLGQEGRYDEAVQTLEIVLSADRRLNARTALVDDLWLLARVYRDANDLDAARDGAGRALAVLNAMTPSNLTAKRRMALQNWLKELGPEN